MTKGKGCLLALVGIPLLLVGAYMLAYPSHSWNQKLTVEVDTPAGVRRGSSVIGISISYGPTFGLPDASRSSNSWRGEATIVELPNGRFLFVLLGRPIAMAQYSFKELLLGSSSSRFPDMETYFPKLQELRKSAPLARNRYPLFVTFTDINDPASVKKVNPNNLAATFGAGFKLKSITLEITDEPVTKGRVEKLLGWFYDVDSVIPKEKLKEYRKANNVRPGEDTPGLSDFVDWKTQFDIRSKKDKK